MKLFALSIVSTVAPGNARVLACESDLSSFNFFTRANVQEFITFTSKTVAERAQPGQRVSVRQDAYMLHAYARSDGLCGVAACDSEYHTRVAFSLLGRVLDEFTDKYPSGAWKTAATTALPSLKTYLVKYQDPLTADPITRVHKDLDDTKEVLVQTLDQLMLRHEKLDDLIAKSNDLSFSSKKFYTEAKKQNECCVIL